uniref:Fibronectin type-III domain-containing protein n=1 Tax=viral metagenome TaxID=1070528 RepID=A0A6C0IH63_9ZZZZ
MTDKNFNLFGFNIRDNNSITRGQSNLDYNLGKLSNTLGSTTRIYKHCSKYSSEPLNCTFRFGINSSNILSSIIPPITPPITPPIIPPNNLNISEPPTNLITTIGNGEATISFTPGLNLGPAITNYLYSLDGVNYLSSGSISSPIRIPGLTNGVTYNITLKAVNTNGSSSASNSVSVTPSNSGPLAPVLTSVTFKTTDTMIIAFTQDSSGITITNYKYSIDGGNNYTAFSPVDIISPVTISGLSSNTTYNISLKAVSAVGESASSNTIRETTYANVNYVTFTDVGSSTWTAPDGVTFVQYLVVGGGGGGGATYSKINVLGNVLVTGTPQAGAYWINNVNLTNQRYLGRMYYGTNTTYQNSVSFTDPVRLTASENILGDANARYDYNKWYGGIEIVYSLNGLVTTSNWVPPYQINSTQTNNISGGSGGGSGGQLKALTGTNIYTVTPGTQYTIVVGAGGQGGQSGTNSETNGSPGGDSSFDTITSYGGSGGAFSRNMVQLQDTNKFGKGGNGGQGYGNLVGGSGGGQNSSNNYGQFNSSGTGSLGSPTNFYGSYQYYGPGGNGGVPNTVASGTTLANVGKGGNGTGATLNSFANGIDGGSGLVVIRYYT